jgi:hypothetical protein
VTNLRFTTEGRFEHRLDGENEINGLNIRAVTGTITTPCCSNAGDST